MPPPTPAGMSGPSRFARGDSRRAFSRGPSMAHTPYAESPRAGSPALSVDGSTMAPRAANQVLRIVRTVRGVRTVEVIKDPAVMESYWRRYQEREVVSMHGKIDELKPTGDVAKDALQKQAYVHPSLHTSAKLTIKTARGAGKPQKEPSSPCRSEKVRAPERTRSRPGRRGRNWQTQVRRVWSCGSYESKQALSHVQV